MFAAVDPTQESINLMFRVLSVADMVLGVALKENLLLVPDRKAVALCLRKSGASTPLLKSKVGTTFPSEDFRLGCWDLAEEKVARQFKFGHMSSYQSRNEEEDKYGGAISIYAGGNTAWGLGISGLKELEDEALAVVIAIYAFRISWEDMRIWAILNTSSNFDLTKIILDAVMRYDQGYYKEEIN